jgi:osmoprotectant transport system substrate-binding protein
MVVAAGRTALRPRPLRSALASRRMGSPTVLACASRPASGTLCVRPGVDSTRTKARRPQLAAALVAVVAVLSACSRGASQDHAPIRSDAVVVASFNFAESELLAEIYAQALESAGVPVRRELDLGTREMVQPAMHQGLVDVVPEYLGTALASIAPEAHVDWGDPEAVLAALRGQLEPWRLVPLRPAPASDQNGFAVTRQTAATLNVHTLTELAAVNQPLVLGGPSECPVRPYCLVGLRRVYGLEFQKFDAIDDETERASALAQGVIDVAVTFTTDGRLATGSLVLLRDDRGLQPAENVVPVVSSRVLQRYGEKVTVTLNAVSAALDSPSLRFLNWRVGVVGDDISAEANGWLARHGLLGGR